MSAPLYTIYSNGRLRHNLNSRQFLPITKLVSGFFLYWKENNYFGKQATKLEVYSQQRSGSVSHAAGKAVDIAVHPIWLMPLFFIEIHKYFTVNVYLSLHNRHIHVDSMFERGNKNFKRVEMKITNDRWDIAKPLSSFINYIQPRWFKPRGVKVNGRQVYNFSVIDRYDFKELKNDYNSTFRLFNLRMQGIKGIALYYINQHFSEIIPENEKERFNNASYPAELARQAGGEIVNIINETVESVQGGYKWGKIGLTLAVPFGIIYLLIKLTPEKEEETQNVKSEN